MASREAAAARDNRLVDITALWHVFSVRFSALVLEHGRDPALVESGYAERFLKHVWQDTLGYAGTELIRRAIGFSHVADLSSIAEPQAATPASVTPLNWVKL